MKKHNGIISFWKFIFTILIIIGHIAVRMKSVPNCDLANVKLFSAYSVGVEFFFIISGYLMTKSALNKKIDNKEELGKITFDYIWKKIKVFFPYILIGFCCGLVLHINISHLKRYQIINTIWDLLLLRMSGIKYFQGILGVAWYISAMLICMIALYPLIIKYKKNFIYIIAPLNVIFIGGYIAHRYGNIADPNAWTGIVYKSLLRAFFELSLGAIAYEFSEKIKNVNFTKIGRFILTLVEIVGFTSIFFIVNLKDAHNRYDFIMVLILFICISIAFSEKSILQKFSNNKVFFFLERISLPMYLNQTWIYDLCIYILKQNNTFNMGYYLNLLIITTLIFIIALIVEMIVKLMYKVYPKVKKIFIIEE